MIKPKREEKNMQPKAEACFGEPAHEKITQTLRDCTSRFWTTGTELPGGLGCITPISPINLAAFRQLIHSSDYALRSRITSLRENKNAAYQKCGSITNSPASPESPRRCGDAEMTPGHNGVYVDWDTMWFSRSRLFIHNVLRDLPLCISRVSMCERVGLAGKRKARCFDGDSNN